MKLVRRALFQILGSSQTHILVGVSEGFTGGSQLRAEKGNTFLAFQAVGNAAEYVIISCTPACCWNGGGGIGRSQHPSIDLVLSAIAITPRGNRAQAWRLNDTRQRICEHP